MIKVSDVHGRWESILPTFGIDSSFLVNKHGACPICKAGKDRFRFDNKNGTGTYICNQCGAGDGFNLLEKTKGWNFATCMKEIEQILPETIYQKPKPVNINTARNRKKLESITARLVDIPNAKPVSDYFVNRGIRPTPELKAIMALDYYDQFQKIGCYPALVARVKRSSDLKDFTYHITYLNQGKKAPVKNCRKSLGGVVAGQVSDRVICLGKAQEKLGIAEGIETALSASQLFKIPVWSVVNEKSMQVFTPPNTVKKLIIFGDNDANYVGQKAAYILANKLKLKGIDVEVKIPQETGTDWNDLLLSEPSNFGGSYAN